jgi:8-hydroxy-5-deazaflavin:NADPH oxidoreductase
MKIAIIGTGSVGTTIASRLVELNHNVMIGTRNVEDKLKSTTNDCNSNPPFSEWLKSNSEVKLGTFAGAASFCELVINATHGSSSVAALRLTRTRATEALLPLWLKMMGVLKSGVFNFKVVR